MGDSRFRQIRPGLHERINTPRHVEISERLMDAIRAESPHLADVLTRARRRVRPWWRRWLRR